jgi:acetate kinase
MSCLAVINAGSSSIKFALYAAGGAGKLLFRGQIEGIGVKPQLSVKNTQGTMVEDRAWASLDHDAATREILDTMVRLAADRRLIGVGHRVVHGGMHFDAPVRLDRDVLSALEALEPLAPLHQPHNLAPIRAIFAAAPHVPQVACFDTAFHRSQSHLAQSFALPKRFSDEGVRRYGFHGLSYEYLVSRLRELAPSLTAGRVIFAHLGNGASLCAVRDGRCVATTMGFTAVDGLVMGTRCGSLDPGVMLYLMREHRMDAAAIEDLIYRQSGLLGVSDLSSDMRTLRASADPAAREAIELFIYRIVRETGSLVAALGGVDAFVFSGGIGENDAATRAEVVEGCGWLGAELDSGLNAAGAGRISNDGSAVAVWVIPTDEERLIARHTLAVLQS